MRGRALLPLALLALLLTAQAAKTPAPPSSVVYIDFQIVKGYPPPVELPAQPPPSPPQPPAPPPEEGRPVREEEGGPPRGYVFIPPWLYEPLMQWLWLLLLLLHLLPLLLLLLQRRRRGDEVELVITL